MAPSQNASGEERRASSRSPPPTDEPAGPKLSQKAGLLPPSAPVCLQFGTGGDFCQQATPKGIFLLPNRPQDQKRYLFAQFLGPAALSSVWGSLRGNPGNLSYVMFGLNNRK